MPSRASLCCAVMIVAASSWARPAAGAPDSAPDRALSLTLEEAMQRAQARMAEVVVARGFVREAEALRVGTGIRLPYNPRVSFDARPSLAGGVTNGAVGYGGTIEAPFDLGGAPAARIREADGAADVARSEVVLQALQARAAAATAYLRTKVAELRVAQVAASLEIAERVLSASTQRAQAGAAGDIDQSLAAAEVAQLVAAFQDAERRRGVHLMELRETVDVPPDQTLALPTPLEAPTEPPDEQTLVRRALAVRPELKTIRKRVSWLDATDERLRAELFPKLAVYLGIDAAPLSPVFGVAGVSVELPFIHRNQGLRARTKAARDTEIEREQLEARRIARAVVVLRSAYERHRAELNVLVVSALPAAERTLALVEAGWRSGRFDIFRLATAARDLNRLRGLRLDALEAAWINRVALDYATGGLGS